MDSSIAQDNTEESCIVNDDSVVVSKKNEMAKNIGKVGMSSRVSSKISFRLPKSNRGLRNHVEIESEESLVNPLSSQRSVFNQAAFKSVSNSFKTMDARTQHRTNHFLKDKLF